MNRVDRIAWAIVGFCTGLGVYACWLFETKVSGGVAQGIVVMIRSLS